MKTLDLHHTVNVVERQRDLTRERQRHRRIDQSGQVIDQPKQRRSWFCSRRCIDRVSWHRKQARIAEAAALSRDDRQAKYGISNHLTLEGLRLRWRNEPRKNEANYRLWFPDLCGLSPEQALAEREQFQRAFSRHQGQADQRL